MLKLTDDDFERLVRYMKSNYGINLEKKRVLIEGRLANTVASRGFKSFKEFIDFAHSLDIAVQYWTINDPDDVAKLQANGADCIMTDDPKMAYNALNRVERIECQG